MASLADLQIGIGADVSDLESSMDDAVASVDQIEESSSGVAAAVEANFGKIGAAAAGIGAGLEGFARSQQDSNVMFEKMGRVTGEGSAAMRDMATDLQNVTFPMEDVTALMKTATERGLEGDAIGEYANFWDMVGDATGESGPALAEAGVALGRVGIAAGDEAEALDAFGYITDNTTGSVEDFTKFIGKVGQELGDNTPSIDDMAGALGALEDSGIDAQQAQRELRRALRETDGDMGDALETLGISEQQYADQVEAVEGSSGAIEANAEALADSFTPMQKLSAKGEELMTKYGGLSEAAGAVSTPMIGVGTAMMGVSQVAPGLVTKIGGLVGSIGSVIAKGAAWAASMAAQGATAVASMATTAAKMVVNWVRMGVQSLISAAKMAAAWVMAMGPVGWIIVAIVALVALIIANWDKVVEWTKKAWTWVTDKIGAAWTWIKDTTSDAVEAVVKFFTDLKDKVVAAVTKLKMQAELKWKKLKWMVINVTRALRDKAVELFNKVKDKVIEAVTKLKDKVIGFFTTLKDKVVEIATTIYTRNVKFWTDLKDKVVEKVLALRDKVVEFFTNLKDDAIKRVRTLKDKVIGFFTTLKDKMADKIRTAVSAIGSAWDGLKRAFAAPVNWVIDNVLNKFIGWVNKIAGKLGLSVSLNVVPNVSWGSGRRRGYNKGGLVPGGGADRDSVNAMLTPGEFVMSRSAVNRIGAGRLGALNESGHPGYMGLQTGDGTGVFGKLKDFATSAMDTARKFIVDLARPGLDAAMKLMDNTVGQWGMPGEMAAGMTRKVGDGILDWMAGIEKEADSRVPDLSGGEGGWKKQWSAVQGAFPGAALFSSFRPNAITSTGGQSWHGKGRAIDITPSMEIFNWIKKNYPGSREIIYSPAEGGQVKNGRNLRYREPVRGDHWDHVHWAYDQGGWLQPGQTTVQNNTGKPEAVLTQDQWRTLADGGGVTVNVARGAVTVTGGGRDDFNGAADMLAGRIAREVEAGAGV